MVINGVTCVPGKEQVLSGEAEFFTNYALSSTSNVYNNAGSTDANAGWVIVSSASSRLIQYKIASPTGTVTITVYGKVGSSPETVIATLTSASATTGFVNVVEPIDQIRIGLKISAGSATVGINGNFKGMTFSI
jgi:hypothetical protein